MSENSELLDDVEIIPVEGDNSDPTPGDLETGDELMVRLQGAFVNSLPASMREGMLDEKPVSVPLAVTVIDKNKVKAEAYELTLEVDDSHNVKTIFKPSTTFKKKISFEENNQFVISPLWILFGVVILIELVVVGWLMAG